MNYAYFPGCTLKNKAKDLDIYARECAEALGFSLEEIPEWQCCGGAFTTTFDEIATKLSSVRALLYAEENGGKLVTVCSACHNVLKQTDYAMKNDPEFALRVNNYNKGADGLKEYGGGAQVIHYLEVLRDEIGFDKVKEAVKNPLTGKKIAPYYGCLLLRPGKVMQLDDGENPRIMEDMISSLGADPVYYPMRNECCGGYINFEDKGAAKKRAEEVARSAKDAGAEMIVTACPLCKYNLERNAQSDIPVVYFTELLAQALGVKEGGNV